MEVVVGADPRRYKLMHAHTRSILKTQPLAATLTHCKRWFKWRGLLPPLYVKHPGCASTEGHRVHSLCSDQRVQFSQAYIYRWCDQMVQCSHRFDFADHVVT